MKPTWCTWWWGARAIGVATCKHWDPTSSFHQEVAVWYQTYMVDSSVAKLNMSVTMLRAGVHVPLLHQAALLGHHQGRQQAENLVKSQVRQSWKLKFWPPATSPWQKSRLRLDGETEDFIRSPVRREVSHCIVCVSPPPRTAPAPPGCKRHCNPTTTDGFWLWFYGFPLINI